MICRNRKFKFCSPFISVIKNENRAVDIKGNSNKFMIIQTITWQQTLPVRQAVIWPNKPEIFCQVEEDRESTHYGAFFDNKIVTVASLYAKTINGICRVRLRYFASLAEYQKIGIGNKLIQHIITDLKAQEVDYLWCDSPKFALLFYKKLGFKVYGEEFLKQGEPFLTVYLKLNRIQSFFNL